MELSDRFMSKTVPTETGCWEWTASIYHGYGQYRADGRTHMAHRYSYTQAVGPIPEGLAVDHLCRNRACVNPAHLEAVTSRENTRRAAVSRPVCRNGLHPNPGGRCIPCKRATQNRNSEIFYRRHLERVRAEKRAYMRVHAEERREGRRLYQQARRARLAAA